MAGNRRGRLKERFEGIHKNLDWSIEHCAQSLNLIKDDNPKLAKAIKALAKGLQALDDCAKGIYNKI